MKHEPISLLRSVLLLALVLTLISTTASLTTSSAAASIRSTPEQKQKKKDKDKNKDDDKGKKHKKDKSAKAPTNAPVKIGKPALWEDRGDISKLDLYLGIGSEEGMPKPPFQFKEEDKTGTNPKIKVIDANGVKWNIKFDEEVHAEVACSRIVWACGYMVEESYFVTSGVVKGVTALGRARKFVKANGSFTDGMFEKRPDNIARRKTPWSWRSNPFSGKKEMSGLIMLNVLVNNWDSKEENNTVLGMYDDDGEVKEWYTVADWGGSLGKTGSVFSHTKWDVDKFAKQSFIDGVSGNTVKLHYSGKMSASASVPVDHAHWFAGIIGQLTDDQLRQAFKAAGATPTEIEGFAMQLRRKINELKGAAR
ncbi:MAG: hypothetical protein AABO41_11895 [Acidobacteriota bacterium]